MVDGALEKRMARYEADGLDIKSAVKSIDESMKLLAKTLVQLEIHHEHMGEGLRRTFTEIERVDREASAKIGKIEERLLNLEITIPILKLTSGWVISGVVFSAVAMGAALTQLIFK